MSDDDSDSAPWVPAVLPPQRNIHPVALSTPSTVTPSKQSSIEEETISLVRQVLNSWTGYQMAVLNQLGGEQTPAKDKWFGETIALYLLDKSHADVDVNEFADWLDDILDSEFDLVLEDGTLEMTAKLLLESARQLSTASIQQPCTTTTPIVAAAQPQSGAAFNQSQGATNTGVSREPLRRPVVEVGQNEANAARGSYAQILQQGMEKLRASE